MRLLPRIAWTGPWYAVYAIRLLYAVAFLLALLWPYVLLRDARPHSWGSVVGPLITSPAFFLAQRHQIEQRAGRSLERCREVIRRARQGELAQDPAELATVVQAVRPHLRTAGMRWAVPAVPLVVAAVMLVVHARHVTAALLFATGWAVLGALLLFGLLTRSQRRDTDLLARLDAAVAG